MKQLNFLVFILFSCLSFGQQVTVFSETFDASPVTGTLQINATEFDNPNSWFSGNADTRTTGISTGYTGASGGRNVFFGTASGINDRNITISNINTEDFENFQLSFGMNSSSNQSLTLEYSDDGGPFVSIPVPVTGDSGWKLVTINPTDLEDLPQTNNLILRFSKNDEDAYRLDDVLLTGVSTIPILEISEDEIGELDYDLGEGPSDSKSFELLGAALNDTDVILSLPSESSFEISLNESTGFSNSINLGEFSGAETPIYVRLKAGLLLGVYSDNITISGGGADALNLSLSGRVGQDKLVEYSFFGDVLTPSTLADNLTSSEFQISSGTVSTNSSFSGQWSSNGSDVPVALSSNGGWGESSSTSARNFFFTTSSEPGFVMDLSYIYFEYRPSLNGPSVITVEINEIEVATFDIAADAIVTFSTTLDTFEDLSEIEVRVKGWDNGSRSTSGGGNLRINDVMIEGAVKAIPALATDISDIDFRHSSDSGPSEVQSFDLSGINLNETNVTLSLPSSSAFEMSTVEEAMSYQDEIILPDYEGTETTIYVRLKDGLTPDTYSDEITISGGGADPISVALSGEILEKVFLVYDFIGETLEAFQSPENATTSDFQVTGTTPTFNSNDDGWAGSGVPVAQSGSDWDADNPDSAKYFFFTITTDNGFVMDVTELSFEWRATVNGPSAITVEINGEEIDSFNAPANTVTAFNASLSDFVNLGEIEVRIKGWDNGSRGTTGGGILRINDVSLVGETKPVDADFYYQNDSWFPSNPVGVDGSDSSDNVLVASGNAEVNGELFALNLEVAKGAKLNVLPTSILVIDNDILNNGSLVFQSDETGSAQLDQFGETGGQIIGDVTVERFIPKRSDDGRAFRFLSSPLGGVDIADSWQQSTHITGSTDGSNGFDETASGAPSMFFFDHSLEVQTGTNVSAAWTPIASTMQDIVAGRPYRLFVRGDRSVDLTNNSAPANDVTLTATGQLQVGDYSVVTSNFPSNFTFLGNPYQSVINLAFLDYGADVNSNFAYYWDPSLHENGGFISIALPSGNLEPVPNPGSSNADNFLRPGQAVFVRNNDSGSNFGIEITEAAKQTSGSQTQVFSETSLAFLNMRLYTTEKFNSNETEEDAVGLRFTEEGNNDIDTFDAVKIGNPGINVATVNGNTPLAIETRALPENGEQIQLFINNLSTDNYTFRFHMENMPENTKAFLVDTYTETQFEIEEGINSYDVEVDTSVSASVSPLRFNLIFDKTTLSIGDFASHMSIELYPNPSSDKVYLRSNIFKEEKINVKIIDILGRNVMEINKFANDGLIEVNVENLNSGLYFIKCDSPSTSELTNKFIKK